MAGTRRMISFVTTIQELKANIAVFNREAAQNGPRASEILRRTVFWLYEASTDTFAPSKFAAYQGMTFETYESAFHTGVEGDRFDGHNAHLAIEQATGLTYVSDNGLASKLDSWADSLIPGVLQNVRERRRRWAFLTVRQQRAAAVR